MNKTLNTINPTFHEYEGFTYLEFEGEFYKGCKRCGGAGHYAFDGEHDRCYTCDNTSAKLGDIFPDEKAAQKWCHVRALAKANRERKREEARLASVRAMEVNQETLKLTAPDVYEFLMGVVIEGDTQHEFETYEAWMAAQMDENTSEKVEKDGFIRAMAETLRWVAPSKPFTEKMISAVRNTMERRAAHAANAEANPVIEGRIVVTGEIVSAKIKETDFGAAYKIVVLDDRGFKVYCSLPKAQSLEAIDLFESHADWTPYAFGSGVWFLGLDGDDRFPGVKGRRITFTATVSVSNDDKGFGFGSRPTKGAWL